MNNLNEIHGEQLASCKIINKENELDDGRKGKEAPALNGQTKEAFLRRRKTSTPIAMELKPQ